MFFENLNFISGFIFIIVVILTVTFLLFLHKKNKKNIIALVLLFLSIFFLSINLLGINIKGNFGKNTKGGKVLFMLDVSKSMNTHDVIFNENNSSRIKLSKSFINNYVIGNSENEYGLSVFAGETLEILPFTKNIQTFTNILKGVDNGNISKNGTLLSKVFTKIGEYFGDGEGTVVIFTDGGDEEIQDLNKIITKIDRNKVNIIIIGVGTEKGGYIIEGRNVWGDIIVKKYKGENVISKLNSDYLKTVSNTYDFEYFELKNNENFVKNHTKISDSINKNIINNSLNNNLNLTRFFTLISFILFILFLLLDNKLLGKR